MLPFRTLSMFFFLMRLSVPSFLIHLNTDFSFFPTLLLIRFPFFFLYMTFIALTFIDTPSSGLVSQARQSSRNSQKPPNISSSLFPLLPSSVLKITSYTTSRKSTSAPSVPPASGNPSPCQMVSHPLLSLAHSAEKTTAHTLLPTNLQVVMPSTNHTWTTSDKGPTITTFAPVPNPYPHPLQPNLLDPTHLGLNTYRQNTCHANHFDLYHLVTPSLTTSASSLDWGAPHFTTPPTMSYSHAPFIPLLATASLGFAPTKPLFSAQQKVAHNLANSNTPPTGSSDLSPPDQTLLDGRYLTWSSAPGFLSISPPLFSFWLKLSVIIVPLFYIYTLLHLQVFVPLLSTLVCSAVACLVA